MARTILYTQEQARNTRHEAGVFFHCDRCQLIKPVQTEGGTGYYYPSESNKMVCYACVAQTDRMQMNKEGKVTLYLTGDERQGWTICNWPGTLKIRPSYVRRMRHPFAREAWIAYFRFNGQNWSAKNIGDNQIARCRRLKA